MTHYIDPRRACRALGTLGVATLLAAWSAAVAAPATARQQGRVGGGTAAARRSQPFGEFKINNYAQMEMVVNTPDGNVPAKSAPITVDATGPNLNITSLRYDMAAPHIRLTLKNRRVSSGAATGGVRVVARNPESDATTTVQCDTARYTAGAAAQAADQGRIDLIGHVHSVTTAPQLAVPLVNDSESGYIEFHDGAMHVVLRNGSTSVTPVEPEPRPGAPKRQS